MKRKQSGDNQDCPRSNRMYRDQDGWYFNTREGKPVGPFHDQLEASTQLEVYIRSMDVGLVQPTAARSSDAIKQKRVV